MATVIMDRNLAEHLRRQRAAAGADRWDEVWDGTYMMAPLPNIEHQDLVGGLVDVLRKVVDRSQGIVLPGANVSDRETGWEHNYRCPDVVVYLVETRAKNCDTHWRGGPDFAAEIARRDDRTREKIPFYSTVGTGELLIVERDPWALELLQLSGRELRSIGTTTLSGPLLCSDVLPLSFRLIPGEGRPAIEMFHTSD